jgi:hypothetical protein
MTEEEDEERLKEQGIEITDTEKDDSGGDDGNGGDNDDEDSSEDGGTGEEITAEAKLGECRLLRG